MPEAVEKDISPLELAISKAENLDQLYEALREAGSIETSQETLTAQEVIDDIDSIRSYTGISDAAKETLAQSPLFRAITRKDGLRDKVKELVLRE